MTPTEYELILYEKKDRVATITINRPKAMNALNSQVADEMRDALRDAEADDSIQVIVITGAGDRAFCAGADIGELATLSAIGARNFCLRAQTLTTQIERLRKPVVAKINGFCLGGGNEVAMSCDFRIASDRAAFGQPEINLGIIPGMGGTQRLTRLIGRTKSMEINMLGDPIPAADACSLGMINKVVPAEELDAADQWDADGDGQDAGVLPLAYGTEGNSIYNPIAGVTPLFADSTILHHSHGLSFHNYRNVPAIMFEAKFLNEAIAEAEGGQSAGRSERFG